jgi:tetratricopeptide (TPR) repeat protein
VRDTLSRVTRQLDRLTVEQIAQRRTSERQADALDSLKTYIDGQITRPWELRPSDESLQGVPPADMPFFELVGERLRATADRMEADRSCLNSAEGQLRDLEEEIGARAAEWLGDADWSRAMRGGRAASACLGFLHLQLGTIAFERKDYADATDLFDQAFQHAAAARDDQLAAIALYQKGVALGASADHTHAESAFRASLSLRDSLPAPRRPAQRLVRARTSAQALRGGADDRA